MSRQSFAASDVADFPPGAHTAYASSTTRTNLWVPSLWTPIPAFDLKPGKGYILRCGGVISTTGTPTIVFNPTFGQSATPASNVALGATTTITLATLATAPWHAEFVLSVRSIGMSASGSSIVGSGFVVVAGAAGTVSQCVAMGSTLTTTADHTTAQGLCLDATWGTNSASNTITAQWSSLQSLN